ncbi:hypothetical protein Tco_0562728 [Tanacetum coccineum]
MGDENPIRTLRDYSKPSHEGYKNTIELPVGTFVSTSAIRHHWSKPSTPRLESSFEARVRDYMAAHTERMERFKNAIFKQHEGINSRMTEMFVLLKELTTSRTPEKVLIREEAKFLVTKNVNSISLTKGEEE